MDALIRSATLGTSRTRLNTVPFDRPQPVQASEPATQSRLRDEFEESIRAELTQQMQLACDGERARAQAEGYAKGLTEGHAAAQAQIAQKTMELRALVDNALSALIQAGETAAGNFEASVGEVAFAAVCRLIGQHAASELFTHGLVKQLCAPIRAGAKATARLHPRDIENLSKVITADELSLGLVGLRIVPDETLKLGGCVVESAIGQFDGSLETQLQRLHRVLTGSDSEGEA